MAAIIGVDDIVTLRAEVQSFKKESEKWQTESAHVGNLYADSNAKRAALQSENDRLAAEVQSLREELARWKADHWSNGSKTTEKAVNNG